jgi:hypothetical protein
MNLIFAHNSHNRPKALINTINLEKGKFPDAKFYVAITQDGNISEERLNEVRVDKIIRTIGAGWQLGCVNCFYSVVSKICEDYEDGIIIFSHDDVQMVNSDVVNTRIQEMIEKNLSFIARRPSIDVFGENYYMMECVYLRISHVKKAFSPHSNNLLNYQHQINLDKRESVSAEAWLASKLNLSHAGKVIDYLHVGPKHGIINLNLTENFGYTHIGEPGWKE